MKYEIGQEVWIAMWESTTDYVTCPDCGGTGRVRVIHHDDTMMSIECVGCSAGYEPPKGYLKVYVRHARAEQTSVTGVEVRDGKTEWRTAKSWCIDEADIFDNEAAAFTAALSKAERADLDEREKINHKEKPTRTWSWNAHYHRKCIKEAQRNIEYHTKKLAAANLKAKEDKTVPQCDRDREDIRS